MQLYPPGEEELGKENECPPAQRSNEPMPGSSNKSGSE